jgi:hypothetical protein
MSRTADGRSNEHGWGARLADPAGPASAPDAASFERRRPPETVQTWIAPTTPTNHRRSGAAARGQEFGVGDRGGCCEARRSVDPWCFRRVQARPGPTHSGAAPTSGEAPVGRCGAPLGRPASSLAADGCRGHRTPAKTGQPPPEPFAHLTVRYPLPTDLDLHARRKTAIRTTTASAVPSRFGRGRASSPGSAGRSMRVPG